MLQLFSPRLFCWRCVCAWNNAVSAHVHFFYLFCVIIDCLQDSMGDATGQNRCICVRREFLRVPVSAPPISLEVLNVFAQWCEKHYNRRSSTLGLPPSAAQISRTLLLVLTVGYFVTNVHSFRWYRILLIYRSSISVLECSLPVQI